MILFLGLGNIGSEYEKTRHNMGFQFLEYLKSEWNGTEWKLQEKLQAFVSEVQKNGEKILLARPTTYMNLSGEAASKLKNYYKIDQQNIYVIYDDLDLPLSMIRIRQNGGPGTHNGMKSLVQHLGENFARIRLGIETRPEKSESTNYVLGAWTKKDQPKLKEAHEKAKEALEIILEKGIIKAMEQFNKKAES